MPKFALKRNATFYLKYQNALIITNILCLSTSITIIHNFSVSFHYTAVALSKCSEKSNTSGGFLVFLLLT